MFTSGLVSVSFRKETPETIVAAAACAGLQTIEWGGDIHVPCGDLKTAEHVRWLTEKAGLQIAAYGSYYRLGGCSQNFETVLATAEVLGAPIIRIWGGNKSSRELTATERDNMVREARTIAVSAARKNITLALECHGNTLTDRWESSRLFLDEVKHPGLKMYWQPNQELSTAYNLLAAQHLAKDVINLHVFHWDSRNRYPLADGKAVWKQYLSVFRETGSCFGLLLEFMHDGRLETLRETAQTLLSWIVEENGGQGYAVP